MMPTAGRGSSSVIQWLSLLVNAASSAQIDAVSKTNPTARRGPAIIPEAPPLRVDAQQVIRVGKTRVTLDTIVAAFHRGDTPEEIARNYDALSLGEVYQAIG